MPLPRYFPVVGFHLPRRLYTGYNLNWKTIFSVQSAVYHVTQVFMIIYTNREVSKLAAAFEHMGYGKSKLIMLQVTIPYVSEWYIRKKLSTAN